jgi:Tfp pilus assembly protein PilV
MTRSRRSRTLVLSATSHGLTLVEVLAALVLLAGTVTAMLLTQAEALRQESATANQHTAAGVAEALIQSWRLGGNDVTVPAEGMFQSHAGWAWKRTVGPFAGKGAVELLRIRLTIVRHDDASPAQTVAEYEWLERPRAQR